MKLPNSMPSQVGVCIVEIYNLKLLVFKLLGERTNHSENKQIYHPNFAWYVERSSSGDINPTSNHLIAFELVNQLLYITEVTKSQRNGLRQRGLRQRGLRQRGLRQRRLQIFLKNFTFEAWKINVQKKTKIFYMKTTYLVTL